MIARSVNAAADVIHRAQVNGAQTAAGIALALESARLLVSPEMAHESAAVEAERDALKARVAELEAGLPAMQEALFRALDRVTELEGAPADAITQRIAPTQALREDGACTECGDAPSAWCPGCAKCSCVTEHDAGCTSLMGGA